MEREEVAGVCGAARVPGEEARDGPAAEDGDHVADAVGALRVVVEHVEEARVVARVEDAAAGVVGQHALVPEHRQTLPRRSRRWRRLLRSRSRRGEGVRGVHRLLTEPKLEPDSEQFFFFLYLFEAMTLSVLERKESSTLAEMG